MSDKPVLVSPSGAARRRHALLGARTRRLARPRDQAEAIASVECLVSEVAGALYAIPLLRVARVAPFRRPAVTPSTNVALLGALGVSGKLYHVFDLGRLLNSAPSGAGGHLVLMRGGQSPVALQVTQALRVANLVELSAGEAAQMRPSHPAVTAFARPLQAGQFDGPFGNQVISILDPEQLTSRASGGRAEGDPSVDQ